MKTSAWGRVAAIGISATVATGCETVGAVADTHAPAIRARLDVIRAIHDDAATRPALDADAIAAPSGGFALAFGDGSRRNTAIAYLEDLERPGELAPVYARIHWTDEIPRCAALVEHHTDAFDPLIDARWNRRMHPTDAEDYLASCEGFEYLIVLRATDFVRPTPVSSSSFDGGRLESEVFVYALRSAGGAPFERLGGFRVTALSSESVSYVGTLHNELEYDLRDKQVAAFAGGLAKAAPGSSVRL